MGGSPHGRWVGLVLTLSRGASKLWRRLGSVNDSTRDIDIRIAYDLRLVTKLEGDAGRGAAR